MQGEGRPSFPGQELIETAGMTAGNSSLSCMRRGQLLRDRSCHESDWWQSPHCLEEKVEDSLEGLSACFSRINEYHMKA